MDDIGKAFVMVGHVLMFALACTISIALYTKISKNISEIFLAHDYSNQGDSIVANDNVQKRREASAEEVILAILDLKNKEAGNIVSVEYSPGNYREYEYNSTSDEITTIGGATFQYNSSSLRNHLIGSISSTYELSSYSENLLCYEIYN